MSINVEKLNRLNKLVSMFFRNKHTIVLNPEEKISNEQDLEEDVVYDGAKWKIPEQLEKYVCKLSEKEDISAEDKILLIYEKICREYVYDDNLISYIKKIDEDIYTVPDWYGRNVEEEWEKNREQHNRRICFELSRYIAKSLSEVLKDRDKYNICIFQNKNLAHYFVGLTSDEYSLSIDLDDFFKIKDLTRVKTDLTLKGIEILEDKEGKFKQALEEFNSEKEEQALEKIENEIEEKENSKKSSDNIEKQDNEQVEDIIENENVIFCKKAIEILNKKYHLDSQGIFEYMKEILDIKLGKENRAKIWKRIDGETTRYIRCLIFNIGNQKYLIDTDASIVRPFDENELTEKRTHFIAYKDLSRGGFDYYDGRQTKNNIKI